jgi:hypothetical protein
MNKYILSYIICLCSCFSIVSQAQKAPVDYVNLFAGTSNSRAMLGPYAGVPYGMVQLGPDNQDAVWMGGYEYSIIIHFNKPFKSFNGWNNNVMHENTNEINGKDDIGAFVNYSVNSGKAIEMNGGELVLNMGDTPNTKWGI